jgi:hypothetical protein
LDTKSKNTIPNKDRIPPKPEQEGDWSEWDRAMEQDELIETGRT